MIELVFYREVGDRGGREEIPGDGRSGRTESGNSESGNIGWVYCWTCYGTVTESEPPDGVDEDECREF